MLTSNNAASVSLDKINNTLWEAFSVLRGALDSFDYKNYILALLFIRYLRIWNIGS